MSVYKIDSKNTIVPIKQSFSPDTVKDSSILKRDAVVLSSEAQTQYKTEQMMNLELIKQRINDGWYLRPEIRLQIAHAMLVARAI